MHRVAATLAILLVVVVSGFVSGWLFLWLAMRMLTVFLRRTIEEEAVTVFPRLPWSLDLKGSSCAPVESTLPKPTRPL